MAATLDDALRRLSASGPECVTGSSNHAPMVIEALVHAGRGDAVIAWLERYAAVLAPAPAPPPLDVSTILGDAGSYAAYAGQLRFIVSLVALYAPDGPARDVTPDEGGLVDRAIASGDEHAIKAAVAAMDAHRTFGGDALAAGAALVEEIERSVPASCGETPRR